MASRNDHYNITIQLCRGGYFLLHNREQPSPRSLINIKKFAVQLGEDISKKNGEMSCNFGEIIKKLYFLVSRKPTRGLPMPSPPLSASRYRTFSTCWTASAVCGCDFYPRKSLVGGGGRGNLLCHSITDHRIRLQIQHEDSQQYSAPLLFRQDLSNYFW